jgi:hypothetical protein
MRQPAAERGPDQRDDRDDAADRERHGGLGRAGRPTASVSATGSAAHQGSFSAVTAACGPAGPGRDEGRTVPICPDPPG